MTETLRPAMDAAPAGCVLQALAGFRAVPARFDPTRFESAPAGEDVREPVCVGRMPDPGYSDVAARELPLGVPPRVLRVELSDGEPHSRETLLGRVLATTNTDVVYARFAHFQIQLVHAGPGLFTMVFHVPPIPFFLKGRYAMHIDAQTIDGQKISVPLTIRLR